MARIIFILLVGIHGLIHMMGFMKAFNFAALKELILPVSKFMGIIWLLTFLLFLAVLILYVMKGKYWWLIAIIAVIVSQTLVITFWSDAKFGTVPNIIIFVVALFAMAHGTFNRNVKHEIEFMFAQPRSDQQLIITSKMILQLPPPVRKWIEHSDMLGRESIYAVRLKQKVRMKLKPEQERWFNAEAQQYFRIDKPSFLWRVQLQLMPLIDIVGRDKFMNGKGEMLIKILSLIPVVNERDNDKINSGTLQRYLGEMVWCPSAVISPYITWETIDELSARATMTYQGATASGDFYFDEVGNFVKFKTQRFMGSDDNAQKREWIIQAIESHVMNNIRIPVKLKATWKLESGDWNWLNLEITEIEYNNPNEYQ